MLTDVIDGGGSDGFWFLIRGNKSHNLHYVKCDVRITTGVIPFAILEHRLP